jgi:hypothetical protein
MFALFLLIPVNSYAQEQESPAHRISLGIKSGLNVVKIVGDDADRGESQKANKPSFAVGGAASITLSRSIGIQPEILYMSKGTYIDNNGARVATLTKRYLEVIVLARFDVPVREPFGRMGSLDRVWATCSTPRTRARAG